MKTTKLVHKSETPILYSMLTFRPLQGNRKLDGLPSYLSIDDGDLHLGPSEQRGPF